MEIVYPRVAAIDVGKKIVAVAVRTPGDQPGQRHQQLRKFKTFYPVLREMVGWLVAQGVTQVAMEATGVYWRPVSTPCARQSSWRCWGSTPGT